MRSAALGRVRGAACVCAATCHAVPQVCACPAGDRLPSCVPALCKQRNHRFLPSPLVLQSAPRGAGSARGAVGTAALCRDRRAAAPTPGAASAPGWVHQCRADAGGAFRPFAVLRPGKVLLRWSGAIPILGTRRPRSPAIEDRVPCPVARLQRSWGGGYGAGDGAVSPIWARIERWGHWHTQAVSDKEEERFVLSHLPAAS